MAKQKSVISLEGTFGGITYVNSKTYGQHVRAARGTHKPAEVNEAFKKSGSDLVISNLPAKMIKDALAPLRENFDGGMLWQELVSVFKKQYKTQRSFDFTALNRLEIHKRYPLSRFIFFSKMQAEVASDCVLLTLGYAGLFSFKRSYIDGYRLSVQAIFPVMEDKMAYTDIQQLPVLPLVHETQEHVFHFTIPAKATVVLFAVKVEGCIAGKEDSSHTTKGMRIEHVLKIG